MNLISDKSYYYWQRKLRKKAYDKINLFTELSAVDTDDLSDESVSFAEVPFTSDATLDNYNASSTVQAVAVIKTPKADIAISNDISLDILRVILQETAHA